LAAENTHSAITSPEWVCAEVAGNEIELKAKTVTNARDNMRRDARSSIFILVIPLLNI
jgi:hypothetical protein